MSTAIEAGAESNSSGKNEILFADPHCRFLSKREIARYLGKHPNTIDYLRSKRVIPYFKIGGSIMFRLKDVERALERFKIKEVAL